MRLTLRLCVSMYLQLTEYQVGRFALYEVKPGILRKAFWDLNWSYCFDKLGPFRKRLEFFKTAKYISVS